MIGIIAAMEKEVTHFLELMKDYDEYKIHHVTFFKGKVGKNDIVICTSGIGKVSSAMIVSIMVDHFQGIEKIINIGVSGGYGKKTKCGDVIVGVKYSYADVDATCFDNHSFGQVPYLPLYYYGDEDLINRIKIDVTKGTILTGDKFFTDGNQCTDIINKHFKDDNVCAFDMESTALAQACYLLKVPFLAIRAISDVIDKKEDAEARYHDYVLEACAKADVALFEILNSL